MTDLDQGVCPPELLSVWLHYPKHEHFLFRVAVREVESWLLGDIAGLSAFLGLRGIPHIAPPEDLEEPKEKLLRLAMRCPARQMREALVWRDDRSGRLLQGPDYNGTMARFVSKQWNISAARQTCQSLERVFSALKRLENDLLGKERKPI